MTVYLVVIYVICAVYMLLNFKHDIHMLQQNSYRLARYWRYLSKGDRMNAWRLIDIALLLLLFSTLLMPRLNELIIAIVCLGKIWIITHRKFKKPLVFTKRVWRIYGLTGFLSVGAVVAEAICFGGRENVVWEYSGPALTLGTILLISAFSWALVMLAVFLLIPVEKSINKKYYNEAASILRSMPDLKVIGITGSYGKTSTKHYLNRILSEEFDVLMTPGSYNTTMGVIRTVREYMKPYNQVFICEMGAKQPGDVKEICQLVHPIAGIVTAVGPMHLETFKSLENVQRTKFELIDSLPSGGLAVVNNDFEYCANREVGNVKCERYAVTETIGADYKAIDIEYGPEGTDFVIQCPDERKIPLRTRLVGECNISNLMAAVIIALWLGVSEEKIRYAVASIEQVEHRLNVKHTAGGITIIDDAFNSNPSGSKMAVDVLSGFKTGRRIIVTPGMIELGDKQFELNKELGKYMGGKVDLAIIVGEYNRDALTSGLREMEIPEEQIKVVDSFAESQIFLSGFLKPGDIVLYENDLPDSFK